jgi:tRNA A-37 threonylcarbamoyl transferase component Bud32
MTRSVWIDGAKVALAPGALLGQGGEAEVYDLGDGRVVKWWKPADHPDFDGMPLAQQAAAQRIAQAPAKLRALPGNLPAAVVAPRGLALDKQKRACGYLMPKIRGTALHDYGEPRWRREHTVLAEDVIAMLLALHDAIAGLHRAGVVIGDCNDLNVLVESRRVHLIDVDSYQLAGFPCSMFSERFVDPRLCDAQQLVPVRPHDEDSDWFAFAVMVFRTLLGVGPWGGVARSGSPGGRALRRHSVLASDVTYPRAARPLAILPDDVLATFRAIFERDQRGVFPRTLLASLHLRGCRTCGEQHARVRCPSCQAIAHVPPAVVHGRLRYQPIAVEDVAVATWRVTDRYIVKPRRTLSNSVWLEGNALMRETPLGPERIGDVLARQTQAWFGPKLGIGFYRASGYTVGFVFRPDRGGLDDRVVMPKLRGQVVSSRAIVGDDRAWLFLTCADGGRLATTCLVVRSDARVLASETLGDATWLTGVGGACAVGPHLFVPTDDGIARIEVVQDTIVQTRVFAETAPFVSASDALALSPGGLDVRRRRDAIRMQLT